MLRGGLRDRLQPRSVDVAPPVAAAAPRGGAWRADNPDGIPLYHLRRYAGETADNAWLPGEPSSCCPSPPSPAPVPDLLELLHVKKGLYNHEQRHRREEALLARQNATAGPPPAAAVAGPSGESCRAGDTRTPPHQPPPGPATPPHPPLLSAVSPTQAEGELTADQCPPAPSTVTGPPSQEVTPAPMDGDGALGELALGATPVVSTSQLLRDSADDDGTESAPVHQADNAGDDQPGDDSNQAVSAGDDVSSSEEYASPAVDDTEEPADQQMGRVVELSAPTEQATTLANNFGEAGREPAEPTAPHGDVTGSNYGTQDEAADTLGPESAWFLAEVTAELRDLGRSPVSEEQWARFEPILDRAEAAIVDHLRLPCEYLSTAFRDHLTATFCRLMSGTIDGAPHQRLVHATVALLPFGIRKTWTFSTTTGTACRPVERLNDITAACRTLTFRHPRPHDPSFTGFTTHAADVSHALPGLPFTAGPSSTSVRCSATSEIARHAFSALKQPKAPPFCR
ncbi:hypothetical protein HPB51_026921 [Rhipicephalus microplus]|uniref:Uncharacterized protein n=1 Tax=Rhipicephalus microplus TaxID=6941 RepID=A0A9J6D1R4_RHIMP|nr:hypothetical protein HPB51_026921 [Rhipicephalus microplus]